MIKQRTFGNGLMIKSTKCVLYSAHLSLTMHMICISVIAEIHSVMESSSCIKCDTWLSLTGDLWLSSRVLACDICCAVLLACC